MKAWKRLVPLILAALLLIGAAGCKGEKSNEPEMMALQQNDPAWSDYMPEGADAGMGSSACGLLSVVNSIRFLTGKTPDPKEVADFFFEDGSYKAGNGGTWRYEAFTEGTTIDKYLAKHPEYAVSVAKYWGGGKCGAHGLDPYLDQGMACVIHVPGHFMAVVARDEASERYFLLDSAANPNRGTTSSGTWIDAYMFEAGAPCGIDDGFMALQATGKPLEHELPPTDNLPYEYFVTTAVYGKGTAKFKGSGASASAPAGETLLLKVRPAVGYECTAVIVGGTYYEIRNNGKAATYEIVVPEANVSVEVCFAPKY